MENFVIYILPQSKKKSVIHQKPLNYTLQMDEFQEFICEEVCELSLNEVVKRIHIKMI